MSTELFDDEEYFPIAVTSKYGGKEKGRLIQISICDEYTDLNKSQVQELIKRLQKWVEGK